MKTRLSYWVCTVVLLYHSNANAQNYTFNQLTATYTNLTGNTVVSSPGWDDFSIIRLHLPFTFKYFNVNQDSLYIIGGFAAFHEQAPGTFLADNLYFFDVDFGERSIGGPSDISTLVTGSTPNRIFKVQVGNAGLMDDASGTENDYANAQLWLFETTNVVEIHFGQSSIATSTYSPFPGPTVALLKNTSSFICLSGSASSPTASTTMPSYYINGTPPNGKVYRFAPASTDIDELNNSPIGSWYPNPSSGSFYLKSAINTNSAEITIYNSLGELVFEQNNIQLVNGQSERINSNLDAGFYLARITNGENQYTQRLIVQ